MKLTDQEKREILRYIEESKPLSDKYRFLLFEEKREVELVWNGKTNEVTSVVLPFQVIEQIDEPRAEKDTKLQMPLFDIDARGRQLKGWTNKLIWGDNKLILSSLKNGPLREEIEEQGGIKLIYIDPPFDVGADFSMDIPIGDETLTKQPTVLEELAYRDTWGKGADSWIAMMYERLQLMRNLLAKNGSVFVHCDWRVSGYLRLILDEVFGNENFRNEIAVKKITKNLQQQFKTIKAMPQGKDSIFHYTKNRDTSFNSLLVEKDKIIHPQGYWKSFWNNANRPTMRYEILGVKISSGQWKWKQERAEVAIKNYQEYQRKFSDISLYEYWMKDRKKEFIRKSPKGKIEHWVAPSKYKIASDLWSDLNAQSSNPSYPTEKNGNLLKRIIKYASSKDDLVADFFVGSGTTAAVAEKLGRKWIVSDLGKFAIHTTRKRMIELQRQLKKEGKNYRAFEILNLGKYERQHYIGVNSNLQDKQKQKQIAQKEKEFIDLILRAYQTQAITGFRTFHGKKSSRMVVVGPINMPVSRLFVEEVIKECIEKQITKVDILAFEFEMGLFPNIQEEAKSKGVDLALKYIPPEVFDKRAIEKNQVVFYDVAYIEVKPIIKGNSVAIELTDFSVFYNQDSIANIESQLRNGGKKLVVENGQIIKVEKDKNGVVTREVLTKKWTDWIDYWAVDFDFESKKEFIRVRKKDADPEQKRLIGSEDPKQMKFDQYEEVWTGDYIFENEWQSFRTKKDRSFELKSVFHECSSRRRKIAIKVVDIFGNDTMKVIEVKI